MMTVEERTFMYKIISKLDKIIELLDDNKNIKNSTEEIK